jgi:UTP--glucose-1-phosphate uridylyltransferase
MEVLRRASADRKGGHVARRAGDGLVLRETAQVRDEDQDAYQDIERHRYFNTNNLWINLRTLSKVMGERSGVLGLPMIVNRKTLDPSDASSPAVFQLETAVGAAIDVFQGAAALEVRRERFAPVKTTNDLLVLRSDCYRLTDQHHLELEDGVSSVPFVDLDPRFYKLVHLFDERFPDGAPSLRGAEELVVHGDWTFGKGVTVRGRVELEDTGRPARVEAGTSLA